MKTYRMAKAGSLRLPAPGAKAASPSQNLHLPNRFRALIADKRPGILSNEAPKPAKPDPHRSTRRKQ